MAMPPRPVMPIAPPPKPIASVPAPIDGSRPVMQMMDDPVRERLLSVNFTRLTPTASAALASMPAAPTAGTAATTTTSTQSTSSGSAISVLAFICKRIPKSPNPEPTLQWS